MSPPHALAEQGLCPGRHVPSQAPWQSKPFPRAPLPSPPGCRIFRPHCKLSGAGKCEAMENQAGPRQLGHLPPPGGSAPSSAQPPVSPASHPYWAACSPTPQLTPGSTQSPPCCRETVWDVLSGAARAPRLTAASKPAVVSPSTLPCLAPSPGPTGVRSGPAPPAGSIPGAHEPGKHQHLSPPGLAARSRAGNRSDPQPFGCWAGGCPPES